MSKIDPPQELRELVIGMGSPVPKIYANATSVLMNNGDVVIVLKHNGQIAGIVNLSYTVTKTLADGLCKTINELESITKHDIMTSEQIADLMNQTKD